MEKEKKLIPIMWLKGYAGYVSFPGMVSSIEADKAALLFKNGYIQLIPEQEPDNPLPDDMPSRNVLFGNGFDTVERVKEAGESLSDILSKTALKNLNKYLAQLAQTTTEAATTTAAPEV